MMVKDWGLYYGYILGKKTIDYGEVGCPGGWVTIIMKDFGMDYDWEKTLIRIMVKLAYLGKWGMGEWGECPSWGPAAQVAA